MLAVLDAAGPVLSMSYTWDARQQLSLHFFRYICSAQSSSLWSAGGFLTKKRNSKKQPDTIFPMLIFAVHVCLCAYGRLGTSQHQSNAMPNPSHHALIANRPGLPLGSGTWGSLPWPWGRQFEWRSRVGTRLASPRRWGGSTTCSLRRGIRGQEMFYEGMGMSFRKYVLRLYNLCCESVEVVNF